jgi:hypothetical protein
MSASTRNVGIAACSVLIFISVARLLDDMHRDRLVGALGQLALLALAGTGLAFLVSRRRVGR